MNNRHITKMAKAVKQKIEFVRALLLLTILIRISRGPWKPGRCIMSDILSLTPGQRVLLNCCKILIPSKKM
jgi:hypothetical protein